MVVVLYAGALGNQFIASTSMLVAISNWSYGAALVFSAGIILVYLLLGGMKSVVKTDIFQYVVLLVTLIVIGVSLLKDTVVVPDLLDPGRLGISLTISFILYGIFQLFASADLWQRVYAARDEGVVKRGLIISGIFVLFIGILLSVIGLAAGSALPGLDPNQAAAIWLTTLLPPALSGIVIVLVFAAVMSSADTVIFTISSSIAKDFVGRWQGTVDEVALARTTRFSIIIVTLVGVGVAYFFRSIVDILILTAE